MERKIIKAIIENILLVSNKPLTVSTLKEVFRDDEIKESDIKDILYELHIEYIARNFQLIEVAGGFQFTTRFEYKEWIKRFYKTEKGAALSKASLETLSVIAYKQPITRIEIEEIRGVDSGGLVRALLEKNLIRMVGKKDVIGKPMMYGTTRKFLEYFGLANLSDLPTLKEFEEKELKEMVNDKKRGEGEQLELPLRDKDTEDIIDGGDSVAEGSGENDTRGASDLEWQGN